MKHRSTTRFWFLYRQLPGEIQSLANRSFELLRKDSRHPSLHLKKIGRLWSVRVGLHYRALAVEDDADLVWFWIGTHDEYDRILRGS